MFVDEDEEVIEIELYAQQFKWTARYAGEDNVLRKS
jgi:cytochrome c oxidase subunit 2